MGADDLGIQSREMVVDGALLALGSFLERMTVREMVRRREAAITYGGVHASTKLLFKSGTTLSGITRRSPAS